MKPTSSSTSSKIDVDENVATTKDHEIRGTLETCLEPSTFSQSAVAFYQSTITSYIALKYLAKSLTSVWWFEATQSLAALAGPEFSAMTSMSAIWPL